MTSYRADTDWLVARTRYVYADELALDVLDENETYRIRVAAAYDMYRIQCEHSGDPVKPMHVLLEACGRTPAPTGQLT